MKTLEAMYDNNPTTELQCLTGIKQARVHQDQSCATNFTFHFLFCFVWLGLFEGPHLIAPPNIATTQTLKDILSEILLALMEHQRLLDRECQQADE